MKCSGILAIEPVAAQISHKRDFFCIDIFAVNQFNHSPLSISYTVLQCLIKQQGHGTESMSNIQKNRDIRRNEFHGFHIRGENIIYSPGINLWFMRPYGDRNPE